VKWLLLACWFFCTHPGLVQAGDHGGLFTIYLVRHAEKVSVADHSSDPALSICGQQRAESLAVTFGDVPLESVYSTPYLRTRDTALPVARAHHLEIESYDPGELQVFSDMLLKKKQNALVIGHSNTTSILAGLLSGEAGEAFAEEEYDRLYLVTISGEQRQAVLLRQAFVCGSVP
jgi:2,3-bisphosphoglycerate-dependent phosphoglycerate mutase